MDIHLALKALTNCYSQNTELLEIAQRHLKNWEIERGFYLKVLNIACDTAVDIEIRRESVLCIKNGVDRYWRRAAPNAIANDEKETLRQKLLTCFNEPINQIALQFSVIISKVAWFDFPKEWPELFTVLLNVTQSTDELHQARALLTMHHVVKALSSKRLIADRQIFHQLTSSIFTNVLHQWINYSKMFLQEVDKDFPKLKELLDSSFVTLKILRKLVVNGFKDCSKETDAVHFLTLIYQQIGPFLDCRSFLKSRDQLLETSEKYLVLLIKVLSDVIEFQPFAFVPLIQPTLKHFLTLCLNREFEDLLFEKFIIHLLNLIKGILLCQEYKPAKIIDTKNALTLEAHKIIIDFFTYPVLKEITELLVTRYFLLSEEDISSWQRNAEKFASDEDAKSWKLNLQPCAEVFFITLFHEFRSLLSPLLVEITNYLQFNGTRDFMDILKKDAVYHAVGLAAFDLYEEADFDSWFTNVLISELAIKDPGYYIIRRRVIWLIGQWVGVKMSPEMKPLLYKVILQSLNNEDNLIVRLAAATTLKVAVTDFEFCSEQFLPFFENSIDALLGLLNSVKEGYLKISVFHIFSLIIERMGSNIRPFAKDLMRYLTWLFAVSGEHKKLVCSIVSSFVRLVQGLGTLSDALHQFLLPMIEYSTDVSQPAHVHLLENGLNLWWAVLDNTCNCTDPLLKLSTNMMPLLKYQGEHLPICLQITEAYIILSPENFLKTYGKTLVQTFLSALPDMKTEAINMMLKLVNLTFIVLPEDGPVLFQPLLPFVLTKALQDDLSLSIYICILSRVVLHNRTCFGSVLENISHEVQKHVGVLLGELLDVWITKMSLFNPVQRRKLAALALTSLLTYNLNEIYDRIGGIFVAILEILNDITKCNSDSPSADMLVISADLWHEDENIESELNQRRTELSRLDPVFTVVLRDYLYNQVMALQQLVGATKFQDLMSTVDVKTMQQLQQYLGL